MKEKPMSQQYMQTVLLPGAGASGMPGTHVSSGLSGGQANAIPPRAELPTRVKDMLASMNNLSDIGGMSSTTGLAAIVNGDIPGIIGLAGMWDMEPEMLLQICQMCNTPGGLNNIEVTCSRVA